jgi:hypothetical protein
VAIKSTSLLNCEESDWNGEANLDFIPGRTWKRTSAWKQVMHDLTMEWILMGLTSSSCEAKPLLSERQAAVAGGTKQVNNEEDSRPMVLVARTHIEESDDNGEWLNTAFALRAFPERDSSHQRDLR